jgi:hypothetical protein
MLLNKSMNKRGIEFSFAWLFAIIIGAAILAAATYFTVNAIKTEKKQSDTVTAFEITALLRPSESGIDQSKSSTLILTQNTKVAFSCNLDGDFGQQKIKTSLITAIGGQNNEGVESTSKDVYIFSDKQLQGKEMKVVSLGFSFPYDIASLLILYTKYYCFVNAPNYVLDEIDQLGLNESIRVSFSKSNCPTNSVKVCFSEETCDVNVDVVSNSVKKSGKTVYYEGNLLYGAIFADTELYECGVSRIIKRASALATLYTSKAAIVQGEGCTSAQGLGSDLLEYKRSLSTYTSSRDLKNLALKSDVLKEDNDNVLCKLF